MNQRKKVISRLKRVKGQIEGIANMVDQSRDCSDILMQIKAARASLNAVAEELVKFEAEFCVQTDESPAQQSQRLQGLVKSLIEMN